ncbi:MAG: DNA gyrase modulator, partial [Chloroflexota bacterium]
MPQIQDIAHELAEILKKSPADYIEAHLEENESSHIVYRGKELDATGRTNGAGGNIRAYVKGGWGFVSFNSFDNITDRVALAIKQAKLAQRGKSELTPVEPVVDIVPAATQANPVAVPLAEKKKTLDEYQEIIWRTPELKTSNIGYGDSHRKLVFVNSSGSYIEQERADITLRLAAVAAARGEVQQVGLSFGTTGDFAPVRHLHDQVAQMAQHAAAMLSAPQAKGGAYTVV